LLIKYVYGTHFQ